MDEQISKPALDRFEVVEPGVGSIELLDQFGDPVLEMAERRLVAARELNPFDLVDQSIDHRFELVGNALAAVVAGLEGVGKHRNPAFERRKNAAAGWAGHL